MELFYPSIPLGTGLDSQKDIQGMQGIHLASNSLSSQMQKHEISPLLGY